MVGPPGPKGMFVEIIFWNLNRFIKPEYQLIFIFVFLSKVMSVWEDWKGDRGIGGERGIDGLVGEVGYPGIKGDSGKYHILRLSKTRVQSIIQV